MKLVRTMIILASGGCVCVRVCVCVCMRVLNISYAKRSRRVTGMNKTQFNFPGVTCLNWRWGPLPMHQAQWGPERPLPPPVSLASQSHHEPTKFPEIPVSLERNTEVFRHPLLCSEKSGKLEVGGPSRDPTGLGALEEGLISSRGRNQSCKDVRVGL